LAGEWKPGVVEFFDFLLGFLQFFFGRKRLPVQKLGFAVGRTEMAEVKEKKSGADQKTTPAKQLKNKIHDAKRRDALENK
jgi:hypothetical protein